ncbi:ABC transporter permease subunit [Geofilum rhodophaeum]|uniref:ABC transporter permease subunit n=1 Tax=Geofilum rhodophaeum TaxID=1965019 RepID=UPI000B526152|nr:ABC transporter permease subunit [Geofilum rhodophaeum]
MNTIKISLPSSRSALGAGPFGAMIQKEMADHLRSWRFLLLLGLLVLTCLGSMYAALSSFSSLPPSELAKMEFFFLKLFSISDGSLPSYAIFIGFLGPLLGIALGFDAINSEHNNGTLSRLLSQPIYRDYVLHAKFLAALAISTILIFSLTIVVSGWGLLALGIPPSADEVLRILMFTLLTIAYISLWINLAILFSIVFRQTSASALGSLSVWLFFSVFFNMLIDVVAKHLAPKQFLSEAQAVAFQNFVLNLLRFNPIHLFNEATNIILMPSVRSTGALTMEQISGTLPGALPVGQSLLMIGPQLTGLFASTIVLFALGYFLFMRREVRSR